MATYDVIIAFTFGNPQLLQNIKIGQRAEYLALLHNIPIFTQKDIPIQDKNLRVYYAEKSPHFIYIKKYLYNQITGKIRTISTLEMANVFKRKAACEPWRKILIVAATPLKISKNE